MEDRFCRCAVQPRNWYHREQCVEQAGAVGRAGVWLTRHSPTSGPGRPQFTWIEWKQKAALRRPEHRPSSSSPAGQLGESWPRLGGSDAARTLRAPRKRLGGGARRRPGCRALGGPQGGSLDPRPALSGGPGSIRAGRERVSGDAAAGGERGAAAAAATVRTAVLAKTRVSDAGARPRTDGLSGTAGAGPGGADEARRLPASRPVTPPALALAGAGAAASRGSMLGSTARPR